MMKCIILLFTIYHVWATTPPPSQMFTCESSECVIQYTDYPDFNAADAVILVPKATDCGSVTDVLNIISHATVADVQPRKFTFQSLATAEYNACWCSGTKTCTMPTAVADANVNFSDMIGTLKRNSDIGVCRADGSCPDVLPTYTSDIHEDDAIYIVEGECAMPTSLLVGAKIEADDNPMFLPSMTSVPAGKLSLCWCSGADDTMDCSLPSEIIDFAMNFIHIGYVIRAPEVLQAHIDCLDDTCTLKYPIADYNGKPTDKAYIANDMDCYDLTDVIAMSYATSNASTSTTDFMFNIDPSHQRLVDMSAICWMCEDCEKSYIIGHAKIMEDNPDILELKCMVGEEKCELSFPNYPLTGHVDDALIMAADKCGALTSAHLAFAKVNPQASSGRFLQAANSSDPRTFTLLDQAAITTGAFNACWCSGAADTCTDPIDVTTANTNFRNHVAVIIRVPASPTPAEGCNLQSCILTYTAAEYPGASENDAVIVINKAECKDISDVDVVFTRTRVIITPESFTFDIDVDDVLATPSTTANSVCWCSGCYVNLRRLDTTGAVDYSKYSQQIYSLENTSTTTPPTTAPPTTTPTTPPPSTGAPTAAEFMCEMTGTDAVKSCKTSYEAYSSMNAADKAVVTNSACGTTTAETLIYSTVDETDATAPFFSFDMPLNTGVGVYQICFCAGSKDCNEFLNYSSDIGKLYYSPSVIAATIQCAIGRNCLVSHPVKAYVGPHTMDRVMFVKTAATCGNITDDEAKSVLISAEVEIYEKPDGVDDVPETASNSFTTYIPVDFSPLGEHKVCWCSGANGSCEVAADAEKSPATYAMFKSEVATVKIDTTSSSAFSISLTGGVLIWLLINI
eukprot:GHVL01032954.1.p1 GENE.GHVL01032954.1~~GHVL01032954.1.p1  ORF type:complete len:853 (+),score=147.34 GHVL01032954.1:125-2683(+)